MKIAPSPRIVSRTLAAIIALTLAAGTATAAGDVYYERAFVRAAQDKCRLFEPRLTQALEAATLQARGAALRAGSDPKSLKAMEQDAERRAAAFDCKGPTVTSAAARVQSAFAGYQRVQRMTYRGDLTEWRADRGVGRTARWRLSQSAAFGSNQMIFGLAGRDGASALVAVASFADKQTPYAARLVMRDGGRTSGPYLLDRRPGQPLSRKIPPRSATRAFMAEARGGAEDELLPKGSEDGWAFRFPAQAASALAELDPREAVAVEFLFPGDRVRVAYVEVGDFAAGRAFLQVASR